MGLSFPNPLIPLPMAIAIATWVGLSGLARGDAPPDISYEAPRECPTPSEFLALVKERAASSPTPNPARQRRYAVVIRSDHGTYEGELTAYEPGRSPFVRTVAGSSCKDVADALAFIAALSGDSPLDAQVDKQPLAPSPPPSAPVAPIPPPVELAGPSSSGKIGAATDVSTLIPGRPVGGFSLFLDLELAESRALSPSFRFAFEQSLLATTSIEQGSAHFRWTLGRFDLCPVRWNLTPSLRARPCGRFEAGAVHAEGDLDGEPRSASPLWAGLSALGRLEWAVAPPLSLQLELSALFSLTRKTFYFQPDTKIYRPPVAAAFGGLGLGVQIW
jgi:hypothetical protein